MRFLQPCPRTVKLQCKALGFAGPLTDKVVLTRSRNGPVLRVVGRGMGGTVEIMTIDYGHFNPVVFSRCVSVTHSYSVLASSGRYLPNGAAGFLPHVLITHAALASLSSIWLSSAKVVAEVPVLPQPRLLIDVI